MWIKTLPVYSKLADEAEVPSEVDARLPKGLRLSRHQAETYRALTEGNAEVIFNTAMTGDGKSLAGQLPVLIGGWQSPLLAMYPTNELVRDQEGQLAGSKARWRANLQTVFLESAVLDRMTDTDAYPQRGDALMSVLRNHDVVLTNPDIFHYVMQQFYVRPKDAPDKVIGPLMQKFGQLTFDEFHVFETPQVISVLNALLFIQEVAGETRPHRYLFLSATPGELMLEYLHRSGLKVEEICGEYSHSEIAPGPALWRQILRGTTVNFDAARVEEWVDLHLDDVLLPFLLERRPGAKGAIIVNSIAAAYRLLDRLKPVFEAHGLTVEPNTGLTSRPRRAVSYEADVLIGTSTVDVGVDFQINFLLFESRDAGSFLQRLGRLGRHEGYERNGQFYPFEEFVAYALVPPWVQEALFSGRDGSDPLLREEETVDRDQLNEAIWKAYPAPAAFESYAHLWGKYQSVRMLKGLYSPTIREQFVGTRERLQRRIEETFTILLRPAVGEYKELYTNQRALLDEVTSFRGGSYFTCGLVDETEEGAAQFRIGDVLQLAANAHLELVDEEDFYTAVKLAGLKKLTFERHKPLAFFRLRGWRQERQNYSLVLNRDLRGWGADQFGKALVIKGFQLDAPLPGLADLNNRLCRRTLPALLCIGFHPLELKRRLQLPLLFAVHTVRSRDGVEGCVAFGREALLLDTRLRYTNLNVGGGAMIV
jgi:CRISPR-associated endonuclease/helicase Cas3